jgi:hypothetical protein
MPFAILLLLLPSFAHAAPAIQYCGFEAQVAAFNFIGTQYAKNKLPIASLSTHIYVAQQIPGTETGRFFISSEVKLEKETAKPDVTVLMDLNSCKLIQVTAGAP